MKPSDFFFGAMDFFAILLPGAILTFLLVPWGVALFAPVAPALKTEPEKWVAFAACAYLLGHLLHYAGSFLDDFYDRYYVTHQRRFGDLLLQEAKRLTTQDLGEGYDFNGPSTFDWASSYVKANNAAGAAEIERSGADSKFFRSLCFVSGVAGALFFARGGLSEGLIPAAIALTVAGFSYKRFCKLRWGNTRRVYEYFVLLRIQGPRGTTTSVAKTKDRPGESTSAARSAAERADEVA